VTNQLAHLQASLPDRYTLERPLGRGGMATVYLANDRNLGRQVALKVLHAELATAVGVERFLREIGTAAGLNHPLILALHDSGEAGDLPFYTMPYVEGEETLRRRLNRERQLSIDDAVAVTCDVAEALAYAHSRGVVHRDIKPENILFSAGRAVVADFGIARALTVARIEPLTGIGAMIGTPAYMSPEQVAGDAALDGRSDQYSLACVLYEMLAGRPPFDGPTVQAVLARLSIELPAPIRTARPSVPIAMEAAVLKALAKVPADRFATIAQFADALRAWDDAPAVAADAESIAVLPFANLSADPGFEYLSDGIAEDIINALAQLPGLRVAARTSSFAFRARAVELAEVGAKLKVAMVLEGSVRKAGNRLRVTAQLVKVGDGDHLWSERYDRDMTDIFAIQDEIAKAIAERLKVTLDGGAAASLVTPATGNLDAYHLCLRGRYLLAQRGLGLKQALECFDQAIALDPNYALAHAGLAEACTVLAQYGLVPPGALRAKAHAAACRALDLAPKLAEAHAAAGTVSFVMDWDWRTAAAELQQAIVLNPRYVIARLWLSYYLVFIEDLFEEGIAHGRRAVELDPLSPLPNMQLGMSLMGAGRLEEAIAPLERAAALAPTMFLPPIHLGVLYNELGRKEEAIRSVEAAVVTSGRHPWTLCALGVCYSSAGKVAEVEAIRDELTARARREYVQYTMLAILSAALGRLDEAFELLERACDDRDGILVYSRRYPFFSAFQHDPRMERIYRRIGLP